MLKKNRFRMHSNGKPVKPRKMTQLHGIAPSTTMGAFNNSLHNAYVSIVYRILTLESGGKIIHIDEARPSPGHCNVLRHFGELVSKSCKYVTPISFDEYPRLFGGGKRARYERAALSLKVEPIDPVEDGKIKMFLKNEKHDVTAKPDAAPRAISPPSDRMILATGCYIKPLEHEVYKAIDHVFEGETVAKGKNYHDIGKMVNRKWNKFKRPRGRDLDVSKLDRSFTGELTKWTHSVPLSVMAQEDREFVEPLLATQYRPRVEGRTDDGYFSYEVDGTLTSGQVNTSLSGILAVTGMLYSFKEETGLEFEVVNSGDDFSLIYEKEDGKQISEEVGPWFLRFGMVQNQC